MTPKELVERLNTVREGMEAGLDDWPIASQIWEYKEAATAIEQLTAIVRELEEELLKTKLDLLTSYGESEELLGRIAELEAENARLKKVTHISLPTNTMEQWVASEIRRATLSIKEQLAAEQLNNKRLRDALKMVTNKVCWSVFTDSEETQIEEALASPSDTSALDTYVAEKVKEAGKFDMWRTNPYTKVLETSIKQLTKQRDLAVEAIRHCIAAMGSVTDVKKAMDWPQLHNAQMLSLQALDAIKESEAK